MTTKDKVLLFLEAKKGMRVSGESIAKELSVSRNAVWKAIRDLKAEGYPIEASTRSGYLLSQESDALSKAGIMAALSEIRINRIGAALYVFDSVASTNAEAKRMAVVDGCRFAVVVADSQTTGRGRYSHAFYSPKGSGIYLSILVDPKWFSFRHPSFLTIYAAVAVSEAIQETTGISTQIKWVNDLYVNEKKVCGILTEAGTDVEIGQLQWLVCGIGLNVYPPEGGFPDNLPNAAALYPCPKNASMDDGDKKKKADAEIAFAGNDTERGSRESRENRGNSRDLDLMRRASRCEIAAAILRHFFQLRLDQAEILEKYRSRCFLLGREVEVLDLNEQPVYTAKAVGLDEDGHLIVQKKDGSTEALSSGEVHVRGQS